MNALPVWVEEGSRLGTWVDTVVIDEICMAVIVFPGGSVGRHATNSIRVQDNTQPAMVRFDPDKVGAW